jgi:hypothetical protein
MAIDTSVVPLSAKFVGGDYIDLVASFEIKVMVDENINRTVQKRSFISLAAQYI